MRWLVVNGIIYVGFIAGGAVAGRFGAFVGGVLAFAGTLAASDAFESKRKLDGFWLRHRGAFVGFLGVVIGMILGTHFYDGFVGIVGGIAAGSYIGNWLAERLGWAGETLQTDMAYRIAYLAVVHSAANAGGEISEREQREIVAAAKRLFVDVGYGDDGDANQMIASAISMLPELEIPAFVGSLSVDWQRRLQFDILRVVFSNKSVPQPKHDWLAAFFLWPGIQDRSLMVFFDRKFAVLPEQRNAWLDELGVAPHASPDEITAAYRKAAAQYHPDVLSDLPAQMLALSKAKMVALNAAYSGLLSNGATSSDLYFRSTGGDRFLPPESDDFSCMCWLCDKTNRLPKVAVRPSARCGDCHALLGMCNS